MRKLVVLLTGLLLAGCVADPPRFVRASETLDGQSMTEAQDRDLLNCGAIAGSGNDELMKSLAAQRKAGVLRTEDLVKLAPLLGALVSCMHERGWTHVSLGRGCSWGVGRWWQGWRLWWSGGAMASQRMTSAGSTTRWCALRAELALLGAAAQ